MTGKAFSGRERTAALHRRMTLEAGLMRGLAIRNREVHALTGLVTLRAVLFGMIRMIEADSERSDCRDFRVAAFAVREVVRAERAAFVVTLRAAVRRRRMHRDGNLRHLVAAAHRTVAARTVERRMFVMTEREMRVGRRNADPVRRSRDVARRA